MSERDDIAPSTGGEAGSWSLLYAADAPLQPTDCPDCGNVFATDSTSCPWCGRMVETSEPMVMTATEAALANGPPHGDPSPDNIATTRSSAPTRRSEARTPPRRAQVDGGVRRWSGLLVAGAILLVIATGITVKARSSSTASNVTTPTTSAINVTTTALRVTSVASSPASAAGATTNSAAPATTAATTSGASSSPTTAPRGPAASTIALGSAVPALKLTANESAAVQITQELATAMVDKNWTKLRQLTTTGNATDAQFDAFYGKIRAATIIPARVESLNDNTFNVWAGLVTTEHDATGDQSALYCARYSVNLTTKSILKISLNDVRSETTVVKPSAVNDELKGTCFSAKFTN